jgi:hypothetical protein
MAESPITMFLQHVQSPPPLPTLFNNTVSEEMEEVVLRCLEKEPDKRFSSVKEFATAFEQAVTHRTITRKIPTVIYSSYEHILESASVAISAANPVSQEVSVAVAERIYVGESEAENNIVLPVMPITPASSTLKYRVSINQSTSTVLLTVLRKYITSVSLLLLSIIVVLVTSFGMHATKSLIPGSAAIVPSPQSVLSEKSLAPDTALAQQQATLVAQSQAIAPSDIASSITSGKLLYASNLITSQAGWMRDTTQCHFVSMGYVVQTTYAHQAGWCFLNTRIFTNVVLVAQTSVLHGDIAGITFRLNNNIPSFYVFEVNTQGAYRFIRAQGNNPANWTTLIDWTDTSSLHTGYGVPNTVFISMEGSQYKFYANKQLIGAYNDTLLPSTNLFGSGSIGFLSAGDTPQGTQSLFSNLQLYQP